MWKLSSLYKPVSTQLDHEDEDTLLDHKDGVRFRDISVPLWCKALVLVSFGLNIIFLVVLLLRRSVYNSVSTQLLYSPAQEAVKYEIKKFHRGFGEDMTIYQQDPSPEVDRAWSDLYDFGIIRIPKSQAELLPNKTYPFVHDDGYYIAELAVFHQLHCLNAIRIALAKDYYEQILEPIDFDAIEGSYGKDHISHCLDALRESVMCASDISVITWKWNDRAQKALGHGDIVHSCRNFESIRDWSWENRAMMDFDSKVFVEDDIVIPGF